MVKDGEVKQRVRELKLQLAQMLHQSALSKDGVGELAALVALAETTTEYGTLYVGEQVTADLLKKLRRTLVRAGRTGERGLGLC